MTSTSLFPYAKWLNHTSFLNFMIKPQITYPRFVNSQRPLEFELCPLPFEWFVSGLYWKHWNEMSTRITQRPHDLIVKQFQK